MPPRASARPPIHTTQRVPNCSSKPGSAGGGGNIEGTEVWDPPAAAGGDALAASRAGMSGVAGCGGAGVAGAGAAAAGRGTVEALSRASGPWAGGGPASGGEDAAVSLRPAPARPRASSALKRASSLRTAVPSLPIASSAARRDPTVPRRLQRATMLATTKIGNARTIRKPSVIHPPTSFLPGAATIAQHKGRWRGRNPAVQDSGFAALERLLGGAGADLVLRESLRCHRPPKRPIQ